MLILFVKSQLALFDTPVMVAGSVRKDGTIVKPHMSTRKKAIKPAASAQGSLFDEKPAAAPKAKRTKLDTFIAKHGGAARLAQLIAGMTDVQRNAIYAAMAKVSGQSADEVKAMLAGATPAAAPASSEAPDLFNSPAPADVEEDDDEPEVATDAEFRAGAEAAMKAPYLQLDGVSKDVSFKPLSIEGKDVRCKRYINGKADRGDSSHTVRAVLRDGELQAVHIKTVDGRARDYLVKLNVLQKPAKHDYSRSPAADAEKHIESLLEKNDAAGALAAFKKLDFNEKKLVGFRNGIGNGWKETEAELDALAEKLMPERTKDALDARDRAEAEQEEPKSAGLLMGADGKPLTVYHGTHADFDSFDRKASVTKYKRMEGLDAIGSWFTTDAEQATHYGKKVIEANLVLRKPMVFNTFEDLRAEWEDFNGARGTPKDVKARHAKNKFWGDADGFVASLKRQGYDGVEIKPHSGERSIEFKGRSTYIVFDGDQVKRIEPAAEQKPAEPVEYSSKREAMAAFEGNRDDAVPMKKDDAAGAFGAKWIVATRGQVDELKAKGWRDPSAVDEPKFTVAESLKDLAADKAADITFHDLTYLKNTVGLKGLSDDDRRRAGNAISNIAHMNDTGRLSGTERLMLRDKLRGAAVLDMVAQVADRMQHVSDPLDAVREYFRGAGMDPKEGDTKTENGVEYVLRDGRWHRAHEEQAEPKTDKLAEARALAREYFDEGIATAGAYPTARFEGKVHQFAQTLGPDDNAARDALSHMFGGKYGNTPPEQKRIEGKAADRLQGEFAAKMAADKEAEKPAPQKHTYTKGPISSDDPDAVGKLQAKLAVLTETQEKMKRANKLLRAGNDQGLRDMGFKDEHIAKLKTKDFAGRTGFPDYALKNNQAEISRLKKRIESLSREAAAEPVEAPAPAPVVEQPAAAAPVELGSFGVPAGITKGERRAINAKVVGLVTADKAEYSDADKALMRQYSGNGGCGDSLNEFYTDPAVASAMWTALRSFGFQGGTVLEPSCATGVFMHTAPADAKVTGVELDPISSKCAQVLHGDRHEIVNASLERFATTDGERQFDLVIGNVPFGLRGSLIKDDKPDLKTAEGYFLDTTLDKTKAGGLVALIVPTGVLDAKSNRALRERLLRKGEFLGAARMPNTAFEHSHTEVTTDVLFYRKRPDDVAGALMTVDQDTLKKLGVWDDEYLAGGYFEGRGEPNIYGTMEAGWRAKAGIGQDITVSGSMRGVPDELAKWAPDEFKTATPSVPEIVDALGDDEAAVKRAYGGAMKKAYGEAKLGDTKIVDGVTYILQGEPPRWHRVDEFMQNHAVTDAQGLAAEIERLMSGQTADRPALEEAVRAYVAKHGIPAKNTNLQLAASQDKSLYRLIGAVNPDGSLSDVVTGRVRRVEGSLDTAAQSLAVEHVSGTFSVDEIADRIGKDADTIEDTLFASPAYAYAGDGQWTTMDQYLTGDMWPKLDRVRAELARGDLREGLADKYALQAQKLEEAIDPKSLEDVEIAINSAFVPTDILTAYFNETKNASDNKWVREQPDIDITFAGGVYAVKNSGYQYGDLEKYLNRSGVRKDDMHKIDAWNEGFKNWLLSSRYRDQVEDLYNRKFRGFRQQEFSDATIDIPGMNTEGLKQYQYQGLRWALAAGKGIIAADVGLGKTVRGLMLAKMAKLNGQAKKPTFVVPKSVLANWVAEADKWFPGSRALVIGETYTRDKDGNLKSKQDTAAERNRKLHELTQNDYDFVFISQPAFNDVDVDPITKGNYVSDDFWVQRGDKLGNAGDKRLNKIREAHKQAMADREFRKRTDAIYFNDLGIDMMLVDEGHAFKNLYAARNRFGETPKFLGGQGLSNRALDMNLKTRWLREQNGGKGIYMLTATPTKNSPLEIYSMLSHIAPEAFERIGVRNSEEFLDRFCEFAKDRVLGTDGTIDEQLVTVGFKNLDELREIMKRYIDRKTAADVGLVLPSRDDRMHMIDMTAEQQAVYGDLRAQLAELADKKDATGDAHIFSIMDKMAKAAMDLELLDPKAYAGAHSPKYAAAASRIVDGAKDGGQVVFAENVAAHEKIAAELVKQGIPRDQIAIINATAADSSAKRQNIADLFNAGKVKVVIGNKTMEEGINLQKGTTDIHHLDLPWEPASMQQRNGRGLRQGNVNEAVRIHTYITKGSFDGYRYQSMMAKKDWQDVLWSGGDRVDNMAREGRFDRSDLLIMMSADPDAERVKFDADKAAAQERFDGEQRRAAAAEFVRFQVMKRSYRELQNKKSTSAERLRARIEGAKTKLANNKYFKAGRAALDTDNPVVIQPDSGAVLQKGVGIDAAEKDGTRQKWVITDVNPTTGDVTMRRYAELGAGARKVTIPAHELNHGVELYNYSQDDENAEVGKRLADAENDKAGSAADMKSLKELPSDVINANYQAFQDRLKDGLKSYKWHTQGDGVGLIDKDGKPKSAQSYEAHKMLADHDLMLPTNEHRAKAIEGYIADQLARKYTTEYVTKRRGGRSESRTVENYPGGYSSRANLWAGIGKHLFGDDFEKEAHETFERRQLETVRRAPSFTEALRAAVPTTKLQYGNVATWPKKTLAVLYAKAKHAGDLDKPWSSVAPKNQYGSPEIPAEVTSFRDGTQVANAAGGNWHGAHSPTVRDALMNLARGNKHTDLHAAMIAASHDPAKPEATVKRLLEMPQTDRHVNAALGHVLAKHPELADKKPSDMGVHYLPEIPYGVSSQGLAAIHKHYKGEA